MPVVWHLVSKNLTLTFRAQCSCQNTNDGRSLHSFRTGQLCVLSLVISSWKHLWLQYEPCCPKQTPPHLLFTLSFLLLTPTKCQSFQFNLMKLATYSQRMFTTEVNCFSLLVQDGSDLTFFIWSNDSSGRTCYCTRS